MCPNQKAGFQHDNMLFFSLANFFGGQLCPIITNEVEALNVNLSALEGESQNWVWGRGVLFPPANTAAP